MVGGKTLASHTFSPYMGEGKAIIKRIALPWRCWEALYCIFSSSDHPAWETEYIFWCPLLQGAALDDSSAEEQEEDDEEEEDDDGLEVKKEQVHVVGGC